MSLASGAMSLAPAAMSLARGLMSLAPGAMSLAPCAMSLASAPVGRGTLVANPDVIQLELLKEPPKHTCKYIHFRTDVLRKVWFVPKSAANGAAIHPLPKLWKATQIIELILRLHRA